MKLILKNQHIHLEGTGRLPLENPILKFDYSEVPFYKDYTFFIMFNKGSRIRIDKELKLPQAVKEMKEVTIEIEGKPNTNQVPTLFFTSDKLPLTQYILLGKDIEEVYPETLKEMQKQIEVLTEKIEVSGSIF